MSSGRHNPSPTPPAGSSGSAGKRASTSVFVGAATLATGSGGIGRVARMSARALIESGYPVSVAGYLDQAPVRIADVESQAARASKLRFALRCHLAAFGADWYLYDSAGIARAHPRLPGLRKPYAVWMHGIEVWHDLRPQARRVLEGAELRLVNSHFTLDKVRALHGPGLNGEVCWLATEEDEPPNAPAEFSGPPTVLILARIDNAEGYKGHAELVSAWPRVAAAVPGARLLIAGAGPGLGELKSRAAASGAAGLIEFTGFVPEEDLPKVWQRAQVFAMPSRNEGFGLVYAEAMRHGLPVIASVHDAGREVSIDGVTGYNVDLDREGELEERLIALLRSPNLAKRLGEAGQTRWSEHFRFSAFKRRLLRIAGAHFL